MLKILCVCGVGQGSSLILKMNVEEILEAFNISASVENSDVSAAKGEMVDYIITNQEFAKLLDDTTAKLIIVDNYFDQAELTAAIKKHLVKE